MKDILAEEIGNRIKSCRLAAGMTQEYLANEIGMTPHQISNVENGKNLINLINLVSVSESLDISMDYLVFGKESTCDFKLLSEMDTDKKVRLNMLLKEVADLIEDNNESL